MIALADGGFGGGGALVGALAREVDERLAGRGGSGVVLGTTVHTIATPCRCSSTDDALCGCRGAMRVSATTRDGAAVAYTARHVILAVPVPLYCGAGHGALASAAIDLRPPLLPARAAVAARVHMGAYTKVVLVFAAPPLPPTTRYMVALLPSAGAPTRPTFDLVENHAAVRGPAYPVLVGVLHGADAADATAAGLDDAAYTDALLAQLRAAAAAAGWPPIPDPSATTVTHWEADPRAACGAYAHFAAADDDDDDDGDAAAALTEPVVCPVTGAALHFAGDGTELEWMGSLHAAALSGRRVAAAVLRDLRRRRK